MSIAILNSSLCESGIGSLSSPIQILKVIAQIMCSRMSPEPSGSGILGERGEVIGGEGGGEIIGE